LAGRSQSGEDGDDGVSVQTARPIPLLDLKAQYATIRDEIQIAI
jgi:hypothetical protein